MEIKDDNIRDLENLADFLTGKLHEVTSPTEIYQARQIKEWAWGAQWACEKLHLWDQVKRFGILIEAADQRIEEVKRAKS